MSDVWNAHEWRARDPSWRPQYEPPRRRRSSLTPKLRRLLLLVAIWLALLVWPTPQLGDFLSSQSTRLAGTASASVSGLVDRSLGSIPEPLGSTDTSQRHAFWQVGLAADGVPVRDTGIRTSIQTVTPQQVSNQTTNYYWVGAYLSDGSFIQAGYYVPWYDSAHAGWFYCAFYAGGHEGPCQYGPLGSVGANASMHTYTMETVGGAAGAAVWRVQVDSASVGEFTWAAGDTGTSAPVIYAESSGFAAHSPTSRLGPVDFSGLDLRPAGASGYVAAPHLRVVYNAFNVCPPYGAAVDGHGGVLLGSGLSCPDRWTLLQ